MRPPSLKKGYVVVPDNGGGNKATGPDRSSLLVLVSLAAAVPGIVAAAPTGPRLTCLTGLTATSRSSERGQHSSKETGVTL